VQAPDIWPHSSRSCRWYTGIAASSCCHHVNECAELGFITVSLSNEAIRRKNEE